MAENHLAHGHEVVVFDDVSRHGTSRNLDWLKDSYPGWVNLVRGDIRDLSALSGALEPDTKRVYHLAAQVAVTTSVADPRMDFEVNALGTFNMLEAVRASAPEAVVLYSSTNKVYGNLENVEVVDIDRINST